jgi:hypothetical protein
MEWLILLLLVPAVVVPVVVLWGFAGCKFERGVGPPPAPVIAPVNLQASARSDQRIDLSWNKGDMNTTSYTIDRAPEGGEFVTIADRVTIAEGGYPPLTQFFDDNIVVNGIGLLPNTTYIYRVTTIVATEPEPSDPAEANAKTFALAFHLKDQASSQNYTANTGNSCFVQRIPAAQLLADGSKLRLQVWGSSLTSAVNNVTVHRIYISRVANPGNPNNYQSAGDIKPVLISDLTFPNDQPIFLPDLRENPIDYTLDQTMDLIIAFDFTATAAQSILRRFDQPGVAVYKKGGVQQAAGPLRDAAGYIPEKDRLYLVTKIIVL